MADETSAEMMAGAGEQVQGRTYTVRGLNVMLDSDLAELYGVETSALNRAVKRNSSRFPADFMFQLTAMGTENLRSQIGISNKNVSNAESLIGQTGISNAGRGGRRYLPYAFTEQGVAILSGVLWSERAIQVNIAIMRAFISLRGLMTQENDLARRLLALEAKYDGQFAAVFEALRRLIAAPPAPERRMGFRAHDRTADEETG